MQLFTHVSIENFRSIKQIGLRIGPLTAFIGTNGSGKSNIFRALNLFFNGELEPGVALDMRRDFHKPWRKTGNRYIDVTLRFGLPDEFNIKQALREPLGAIGITNGATFSLAKRWERDQLREGSVTEELYLRPSGGKWSELEGNEARAAARFLQLIRFRYIPNHVHPVELLRSESGALQESLITALRASRSRQATAARPAGEFDAVLKDMAAAAKSLVAPLSDVLSTTPGHVEGIEIATPTDWAEVVWSLALRLQARDVQPLDAAVHGSGNQTFLMYLLIRFIDTRFAQRFGWHQATVWAVEEPESFLHADLENRLATYLMEACAEPRFQALLTTHELLFASAADVRHSIELVDGEATATKLDVLELADRTLASGVTGFVHPLNLTQPKPTLIVDGPYDVFYVTEAYRHSGRINPWDIRSLETIDPSQGGSGKTALKAYLRANSGPLRARPSGSPVIVLLDWEDTETERRTFAELVAAHATSTAIVWPVDLSNPQIGESFRGIERYLGSKLIEHVAKRSPSAGITRTLGASPLFELQPQKKTKAKQELVTRCRARDRADDVDWLVKALDWLDSQLPKPSGQSSLPGT